MADAPVRSSRPRGFTLIELLVVVSVIALLIAISLPSIGKAKAKAMTSVCATRLHALGIAMATYLSEYNDRYPINGIIIPKSQVPTQYKSNFVPTPNPIFAAAEVTDPDHWRIEYGALYKYMGGLEPDPAATLPLPYTPPAIQKAYLCPADVGYLRTNPELPTGGNTFNCALTFQAQPTGGPKVVQIGPGSPGYWSYSINSVLNSLGRFRQNFITSNGQSNIPWADPLRNSSVRRTQEFITFVEEANDSKFNDEVLDAPAYSNPSDSAGLVDRLTDRHSFNGNVMFGDWHVEPFNAVTFNYVPTASGSNPHVTAMQSSITRMFFPDFGDFSATLPP